MEPFVAERLFVVSAPSGAGKTTLLDALVRQDPALCVSVSHTTRPKRAAEVDGVHYHFTDSASFAAMRDDGDFLEWAQVFGHAYGTSRRTVADAFAAGRDVVLEIDWQGARQVRQRWRDPVSVFVLPPSRQALLDRLQGRGQDAPAVIATRMAQAVADISHHGEFDHIVVNDDFETALGDLQCIVRASREGVALRRRDHGALLQQLLSP